MLLGEPPPGSSHLHCPSEPEHQKRPKERPNGNDGHQLKVILERLASFVVGLFGLLLQVALRLAPIEGLGLKRACILARGIVGGVLPFDDRLRDSP